MRGGYAGWLAADMLAVERLPPTVEREYTPRDPGWMRTATWIGHKVDAQWLEPKCRFLP